MRQEIALLCTRLLTERVFLPTQTEVKKEALDTIIQVVTSFKAFHLVLFTLQVRLFLVAVEVTKRFTTEVAKDGK